MKNFKQSRALASTLFGSSVRSYSTTTSTALASRNNTKQTIISKTHHNTSGTCRCLACTSSSSNLLNNNNKKNQASATSRYYSTTTQFTRGSAAAAARLQDSEAIHHTIIATLMSEQQKPTTSTTHQHDGTCCGGSHHHQHLNVHNDVSPNSLSGDESSEFNTVSSTHTKKKVSGLSGIKKKSSSSSSLEANCSHQIDYSQLSANSQNPNLSRPEPADLNLSYTIEGLLQKKPEGINAAVQEEEFTEEELVAQQSYEKLLNNNKEFVKDKLGSDPDFFNRIKDVQKPDYMLIGCSDSRVPPDQLTKTQPGQIFIHRNVANLVVNTDVNAMSVLQYAVEVLQVKHVIVMGHTRCGGVMAALTNKHLGLIDHWLRNIKDVYRLHKAEVDAIEDKDKKIHRMIELNIIEQTLNLCKTSVVQNAWAKGRTLHVHGWLCDIETGLIKDLEIEETRWKEIENIYKYDFDL